MSASDCDPKTKSTYFYHFLECPFGLEYNFNVMVVVPDGLIFIEILCFAYLIHLVG